MAPAGNGFGAILIAMITVGPVTAILGLVLFAGVICVGLWAVRRQSRMFPKEFDRTGWSPEREHAGWFATKFTWLSGGRG
jgi:hypothetical protein